MEKCVARELIKSLIETTIQPNEREKYYEALKVLGKSYDLDFVDAILNNIYITTTDDSSDVDLIYLNEKIPVKDIRAIYCWQFIADKDRTIINDYKNGMSIEKIASQRRINKTRVFNALIRGGVDIK